MIEGIVKGIAGHVESNIDPNNKLNSVLNLLAPGLLMASGFPILAFVAEMATQWFGINLGAIFSDIASALKSLLSGGSKLDSGTVDSIAAKAVSNHEGSEPTQQDLEAAQQKKLTASSLTITEAKLYKAAIIELMDKYNGDPKNIFNKRAGFLTDIASFIGLKGSTSRVLVKVIGWVVKTVLWAGGFMLANDAIHSVLGVPKITPGSGAQTVSAPVEQTAVSIPTPKQTLFAVNPAYTEEKLNINSRWIEPVSPDSIDQDIVQWAEDIYPDLKGRDADIRSTSGFQKAVEVIKNYNATNTSNVTFMPRLFTSRKKVVDLFIDELAGKVGSSKGVVPIPKAPSIGPKPSVEI
jgi:hypothetical protein